MAKASKWQRATLRERLLSLPAGAVVAVIQTKVVHTSVGPTYWVMSVSKSVVYQVAESFGGPSLRHMLKYEREASNQEFLTGLANTLLADYQKPKVKSPSKGATIESTIRSG